MFMNATNSRCKQLLKINKDCLMIWVYLQKIIAVITGVSAYQIPCTKLGLTSNPVQDIYTFENKRVLLDYYVTLFNRNKNKLPRCD